MFDNNRFFVNNFKDETIKSKLLQSLLSASVCHINTMVFNLPGIDIPEHMHSDLQKKCLQNISKFSDGRDNVVFTITGTRASGHSYTTIDNTLS
jgi:hypothetical protein